MVRPPSAVRCWRGSWMPFSCNWRKVARAARLGKEAKDQPHRVLHLPVGRQHHLAIWQPLVANGEPEGQLAAPGFVQPRRLHLLAHKVPLCFGKGTFDAQEQAVIVSAGIVEAAAVADEHVVEGGQVQQLVPVGAIARQARDVGDQEDAHLACAHVGKEALEAVAVAAADGRFAQVFVDDHNLALGPAQRAGAGHELVLQILGLLMFLDLAQRRLAHVEVGQALPVAVMDEYGLAHGLPPGASSGWLPCGAASGLVPGSGLTAASVVLAACS